MRMFSRCCRRRRLPSSSNSSSTRCCRRLRYVDVVSPNVQNVFQILTPQPGDRQRPPELFLRPLLALLC